MEQFFDNSQKMCYNKVYLKILKGVLKMYAKLCDELKTTINQRLFSFGLQVIGGSMNEETGEWYIMVDGLKGGNSCSKQYVERFLEPIFGANRIHVTSTYLNYVSPDTKGILTFKKETS